MAPPLATPPDDRPAVELLEAVVRDAHFMADLTAAFLDRIGALPPTRRRRREPVALPREFLLELAAILRIALWERAGLREPLGPGLPPAGHALADLFARHGLEAPEAGPAAPLEGIAQEVFRATLGRLAWAGRSELDVDVMLDGPEEEVPLEALADLLWAHRHAGRPRG